MAKQSTLRGFGLSKKPASNSFAITPHITNEVGEFIPRGIFVGGAGTLDMRLEGDTVDVQWTVLAGTSLDVQPVFIRATSTATLIIGLY